MTPTWTYTPVDSVSDTLQSLEKWLEEHYPKASILGIYPWEPHIIIIDDPADAIMYLEIKPHQQLRVTSEGLQVVNP